MRGAEAVSRSVLLQSPNQRAPILKPLSSPALNPCISSQIGPVEVGFRTVPSHNVSWNILAALQGIVKALAMCRGAVARSVAWTRESFCCCWTLAAGGSRSSQRNHDRISHDLHFSRCFISLSSVSLSLSPSLRLILHSFLRPSIVGVPRVLQAQLSRLSFLFVIPLFRSLLELGSTSLFQLILSSHLTPIEAYNSTTTNNT